MELSWLHRAEQLETYPGYVCQNSVGRTEWGPSKNSLSNVDNDKLSSLDQAEREERKKTILDLWLKCYTAEEIGGVVGLTKQAVDLELSQINGNMLKLVEVQFSEADYAPPIYNVWAFGKKTNETEHFGNLIIVCLVPHLVRHRYFAS